MEGFHTTRATFCFSHLYLVSVGDIDKNLGYFAYLQGQGCSSRTTSRSRDLSTGIGSTASIRSRHSACHLIASEQHHFSQQLLSLTYITASRDPVPAIRPSHHSHPQNNHHIPHNRSQKPPRDAVATTTVHCCIRSPKLEIQFIYNHGRVKA